LFVFNFPKLATKIYFRSLDNFVIVRSSNNWFWPALWRSEKISRIDEQNTHL